MLAQSSDPLEKIVSDSKNESKNDVCCAVGVAASEKIAERDLKNMDKYKETITKVANSKCIPPSLVAAVISRESHAGTALKDGWGDHGNAFGLMQVWPTLSKLDDPNWVQCQPEGFLSFSLLFSDNFLVRIKPTLIYFPAASTRGGTLANIKARTGASTW